MEKVEKKQVISIIICWLVYTSVYFGRYSYSANISLIEDDYNVTHAAAGLVMTFFSIAYGSSQIFHGLFCKKYPRRYIVPFALLVAAFMDIMIYVGVPFYLVKYMWLISAVCQAILWPMLMQILSENVGQKLMETAVVVMSTTTAVGTLLVYGLSALLARINYKLTFLVGALIIIAAAITWIVTYEPNDCLTDNVAEKKEEKQKKHIGLVLVPPIVLLCVFSAITNFAKDGLQTWVPVILKSIHHLPDSNSILLTLVLPVFGIFGSYVAIIVNKQIKPIILLTVFFMSFAALFNFVVIKFQNNLIVTVVSFGMLELILHGCCGIFTSIFPLYMREKMSSGALAGILNGCAYAGSASSSYILGKIADVAGWNMVFVTLLSALLGAALFGAIYWLLSFKNKNIRV